jgi:hypothetical protein
MARLMSEKALNTVVARIPGVHDALGGVARRVAGAAKGRLAVHKFQGHSRITITEGDVDWFVNLDDSRGDHAAMSIEFGHIVKGKYEDPGKPKYVPGLYILSTAAGLA